MKLRMNLERTITCFDESTDEFIKEIKLKEFPIELIKPLWDDQVSLEDPEDLDMIFEYPIERKQFEALQNILPEVKDLEWNEERFAYFISTNAIE